MLAVDRGVIARLKSDATLVGLASGGIHRVAPPEGTAPPFLVFHALDDEPAATFGTPVNQLTCLYLVQGVGAATATKGAGDVAAEMRERAVATLTGRTGTAWGLSVTGYTVKRVAWVRNMAPQVRLVGGAQRAEAAAYVAIWLAPA